MSIVSWIVQRRDRFFMAVDSGQVKMFQAIVYFWMTISGGYMIWHGSGPSVIEQELSATMHQVWVWLAVVGPLMVTAGDLLVRRGETAVFTGHGGGRRVYWGWYLQLGGDIVVTMVFLTYVIASLQAAWLQRGIFAAFIVVSLAMCSSILALRDFRSVRGIEKMRRV